MPGRSGVTGCGVLLEWPKGVLLFVRLQEKAFGFYAPDAGAEKEKARTGVRGSRNP
jgi:hypothetical protein